MAGRDLVEAVARALWKSDKLDWISPDYSQHEVYIRRQAKVAIVAVLDSIAEPSEAMQIAGHNIRNDLQTGMPTSCGTDEIYRAMIAALRAEVEECPGA